MTLATHPGFTRAVAAVRAAEIGLLRAAAVDIVAVGTGIAVDVVGTEAIGLLRAATGPTSVTLQAHTTGGGAATTFLGRADHGVAVSAHLSLVEGPDSASGDQLRAHVRLVGSHGSVVVDLLRPQLELRTASSTTHVPFGVPGPQLDITTAAETLAAVVESAQSGTTVTTQW
ncbi:hypothetical protein [Parenemella sanctibonifatiensis]|uniref:Uncharacterized protein n=1 Tax=Parenemella sanctibonifatiensis TaxID=2016505 RepID=A0A255EF60_9ACTN|nr:hypothetical protein [Parenemella sanctibonifatiensis]OYN88215.1 hypothetical protein CGZ92_04525 [Parenemella sanctibonifatiensis]